MRIAIAIVMRPQAATEVQTHFIALRRGLEHAGLEVVLITSFSYRRFANHSAAHGGEIARFAFKAPESR